MSEYQRIAFRAIDGPVSDKNLAYMRRQSSRAEITPWSFDNEYHWGDFGGDPLEMLRRGYDFYLHYANFGLRKLLIRLPYGLPDEAAARPYFVDESLAFLPDKSGPGGALVIEPYYEPGEQEDIYDIDPLINELIPLRAEILAGDLRPLYLAHLAVACDMNHDPEEATEAPVPAGLRNRTSAQKALAELYGLSDALLAAAARESPPLPEAASGREQQMAWLRAQPQSTKDGWLAEWMTDPQPTARREILAAFQKDTGAPAWPGVHRGRTITALEAEAAEIATASKRKAAEKAAKARAKRLTEMAADPEQTLRQAEKLVARRSQKAYEEIAALLADLREALAGTAQSRLAEERAQKLRAENPTLRLLVSELRRKGFLPK